MFSTHRCSEKYFYRLLSPTAFDAKLTSVTGAYAVTCNSNNDVANIRKRLLALWRLRMATSSHSGKENWQHLRSLTASVVKTKTNFAFCLSRLRCFPNLSSQGITPPSRCHSACDHHTANSIASSHGMLVSKCRRPESCHCQWSMLTGKDYKKTRTQIFSSIEYRVKCDHDG